MRSRDSPRRAHGRGLFDENKIFKTGNEGRGIREKSQKGPDLSTRRRRGSLHRSDHWSFARYVKSRPPGGRRVSGKDKWARNKRQAVRQKLHLYNAYSILAGGVLRGKIMESKKGEKGGVRLGRKSGVPLAVGGNTDFG